MCEQDSGTARNPQMEALLNGKENKYGLTVDELITLRLFHNTLCERGTISLLLMQLALGLAHNPVKCSHDLVLDVMLEDISAIESSFGAFPAASAEIDMAEAEALVTMQDMLKGILGDPETNEKRIKAFMDMFGDRCANVGIMAATVVLALTDIVGELGAASDFDPNRMVEAAVSLRKLAELAAKTKNTVAFPEGYIPNEQLIRKLERLYDVHRKREFAIQMGANPQSLRPLKDPGNTAS